MSCLAPSWHRDRPNENSRRRWPGASSSSSCLCSIRGEGVRILSPRIRRRRRKRMDCGPAGTGDRQGLVPKKRKDFLLRRGNPLSLRGKGGVGRSLMECGEGGKDIFMPPRSWHPPTTSFARLHYRTEVGGFDGSIACNLLMTSFSSYLFFFSLHPLKTLPPTL